MVNRIAVTTLLLPSCLSCCYQRIFNQKTNYFPMCRFSIPWATLSEICV